MAKGRHLKPDFFTDKHIVSLSPLARLLYQGLWCHAADCGHVEDEPVEFKMRILPADNCDVDTLLDEIADRGRIHRSEGWIYIPKLREHGRIDKRYETECEVCKKRREHAVNGVPTDPAPVVNGLPETPNHDVDTTGSHSEHDVTTRADPPKHDADGDGDGDGDGDVGAQRQPRKRGTQIPNDFRPNQKHIDLAAELAIDLRKEWEKFVDHHRAKGSTFKDWNAALRNWIRTADEYRKGPRPLPTAAATPDQLPPVEDSWMRRRA